MKKLVKRWAVTAIAVPLAAAGARGLSRAIERRRGPSSRASSLLRHAADTIRPRRASRWRRRRW